MVGNKPLLTGLLSTGILATLAMVLLGVPAHVNASNAAHDPGPRVGGQTGNPLPGLDAGQTEYFNDGALRFSAVDSVKGTIPGEPDSGLGPSFNGTSCASCHAQPAVGGSSPSTNPQMLAASDDGADNVIPSFLSAAGPVVEARFPFVVNANGRLTQTPDGSVHDLFTIAGRSDAAGCTMAQPDFAEMEKLGNVILRIPTPLFGAGLIENIPEAAIYRNWNANAPLKHSMGIIGHPNISASDGTVTRFGWKAQNKSVEIFAAEAYNVEMGVTNEIFPQERGMPPANCLMNPTPEDSTHIPASGAEILSDTAAFSSFMRFLAPPAPATTGIPGDPAIRSISTGRAMFTKVHCDLCHTPALHTGASSLTGMLNNKTVDLYSDLLVHHMGVRLADNITQGVAGVDEFRTAPLWGLGQRIYFLHDGRATPANGGLLKAIEDHAGRGSEANEVIALFSRLSVEQQQDLLNFLRSL